MGFIDKMKALFSKGRLDAAFFEELEDLLVEGDFGPAEAVETVELLSAQCKKERISDADTAREALAQILCAELGKAAACKLCEGAPLEVIMLLGVNGVGKTTSAAKLASLFSSQATVLLAAADTFRAAASEQLKIHGERLGLRVIAHKQGGDPAAVIFDALSAAASSPKNHLIIADTAGRMHTKAALIEELKKIDRVIETKAPTALLKRVLVLDSTTGRNALAQAEAFNEAVHPDGCILTKTDSTARGGVVLSLAERLGIPVLYTCNGEKYADISPFDPLAWSRTFVGL
jgi:fused signal recognition particle receptor